MKAHKEMGQREAADAFRVGKVYMQNTYVPSLLRCVSVEFMHTHTPAFVETFIRLGFSMWIL